jgi:hypothetical protein
VTARITAAAQILLSAVFLIGYFWVLQQFLEGLVQVATVWRDQIGIMLGVLTGGVMIVLQFWFTRHRGEEPPKDKEPK